MTYEYSLIEVKNYLKISNMKKICLLICLASVIFMQCRNKVQNVRCDEESENEETVDLFPFANGVWGFIDKRGTIVVNPQFDAAEDFHEGLARVCSGDKWGYIDKEGKYVIPSQFDVAKDFHDGLACVCIGNRWGYIDKTGKYVVNPQLGNREEWSFFSAHDFHEGLAAVCVGDRWG